jgi:hypothetical protein
MLFQKIIIRMKPRLIKLVEHLQKIVLVYTDAAWEVNEVTGEIVATLGTLLMNGNETIARAAHAPRDWIESLKPRKSQILACELIALAGLLLQDGEGLKDQHVLIFIDNLAGACLLTKASTEQADIQWIVAVILARLTSLECLWWIEWLPSEANPADPISRFVPQSFADIVLPLEIPGICYPKDDLRAVLDEFL